LAPQKRFVDLISAFSRLPRHIATQLVIVGSGSELSALSTCARVNHVQDRVCFLGETADVMHWLDRCSLFVLSSAFEGFPNALAEAMARGCAVVSTDCETGPAEMIEHDASGLLVPVGEIGALSSAMFRVLDSQVLASQFGVAARQRAESWSLEKIVPMWI
jgi:glycosyltransferase involved in cell wall biosynthesis